MNGVLLDTHVLIWYLAEPEKLSFTSSNTIDDTVKNGETLFVSAITIIEIIYLVEKNKIPEKGLEALIQNVTAPDAEIQVLPLDLHAADELRNIPRDQVPDMPDRIIAATAKHHGLPLITKDNRIKQAAIETIW
jgi:PIN domain nuclease of toxin-antitoxin system